MTFHAIEFHRQSHEATGTIATYQADGMSEALSSCLYTQRLADGSARPGPSGRTVFTSTKIWVLGADRG